MVVKAC